MGMFSEWISLRPQIQESFGAASVLHVYPPSVGKEVTSSVLRSLILLPNERKPNLDAKEELDWTMEVICYGLTLPLSEADIIKSCTQLYLDWTTCITMAPKSGVPLAILEEKKSYFRKMLWHLTNLFFPKDSASIGQQANLCSQVLHHIRMIASDSPLDKETWDTVLHFFLGVSGHLLSPPPQSGGLAEALCEQLINTLFQVWIIACSAEFPSPPLWCTLQDLCLSWRHHHILVLQWNGLMYVLLSKIMESMYGPRVQNLALRKIDNSYILPRDLTPEVTVQCWFRFLHILGNPVSLSRQDEITNTDFFMAYALEQGRSPTSHSSLRSLPDSFLKAMKGISVLVHMLLTVTSRGFICYDEVTKVAEHLTLQVTDMTKSASLSMLDLDRERPKPIKLPSMPMLNSAILSEYDQTESLQADKNDFQTTTSKEQALYKVIGPETNSILHIFGAWLFDVCLCQANLPLVLRSIELTSKSPHSTSVTDGSIVPVKDEFEPGRAEAFGILCQIFCSQKSGQTVLPVYLARFYLSLALGLCYQETCAGQVLSSILMGSKDLLRIDLQGVQVLVPHLIQALEIILPVQERELNLGCELAFVQLRRSCIHLLLSMLCLPLHFLNLSIQAIWSDSNSCEPKEGQSLLTFLSLKPRLTKLLMDALEVENDPANTQMLLGGTIALIEDTVAVESRNLSANESRCGPGIIIDEPDNFPFDQNVRRGSVTRSKTEPTNLSKYQHEGQKFDPRSKSEKDKTVTFQRHSETLVQDPKDLSTTKGMFRHMSNLLSQKLMFSSKWRVDLNVTLAALDLLAGMAKLDASFLDKREAIKMLNWICHYISFQTNKPAQFHVRDLHSIIVAAFGCLATWVVNHSWLLSDQSCLDAVLEVIELGISGSRSTSNVDSNPVLKGDKELKPASFRVREAAEGVLSFIMEQLDFFPGPSGPASLSTLLTEEALLKSSVNGRSKKFRYFAMDSTCIVGILEDTLVKSEADLPTVSCILRGPTGRHATLLQLRHFSKARQDRATAHLAESPRPSGLRRVSGPGKIAHKFRPDGIEKVEQTKAESSIPEISDICFEEANEVEQNHVRNLIEIQGEHEDIAVHQHRQRLTATPYPNPYSQQKQPTSEGKYEGARLFLSHMGMLTLDCLEGKANRANPSLLQMEGEEDGFKAALKALDKLSSRTYDTMHVFYVKKGQRDPADIYTNRVSMSEGRDFYEFLYSLGWPVNTDSHPGWTGNFETSWTNDAKKDVQASEDDAEAEDILYYSDFTTELAIKVPVLNMKEPLIGSKITRSGYRARSRVVGSPKSRTSFQKAGSFESKDLEGKHTSIGRQTSDPTGEGLIKVNRRQVFSDSTITEYRPRSHSSLSETKVVVAWLQDFDDSAIFPVTDLLTLCGNQDAFAYPSTMGSSRVPEREVVTVFIHPLKTGLYRIKVTPLFGPYTGGPLIDGMVLSRRILGVMVRNTAINIFKRRRLEIDSYSPPHVCRKLKIQDIVKKFGHQAGVPEFYVSLFTQAGAKQ